MNEKPKLWKVVPTSGRTRFYGDNGEEIFDNPFRLCESKIKYLVELHNAAEIQLVTGWHAEMSMQKWIVREGSAGGIIWEAGNNNETPAKAIIAAWEWMQARKGTQ